MRSRALAFFVAAAAFGGSGPPPVSAQAVENSDIYVTVTELADEVELIRELMGRPFDDSARLPVSGITEWELYFQTETLLIAANRLAHELADAELAFPPPMPSRDIATADVLSLAERALADVRLARDALGITEPVIREDRDQPIAPTGVFSVVLDANRQLNLLLRDAFSSTDVHRRLSVAATLAAGILQSRGVRSPAPPDATDPRLPADVYRELFESIDRVTAIAARVGVPTLTLSARRNVPDDITPGDVYNLAQFLVADLAALSRAVDAAPAAVDLGPAPRHLFPAQTYRVALLLQRQLEAMEQAF